MALEGHTKDVAQASVESPDLFSAKQMTNGPDLLRNTPPALALKRCSSSEPVLDDGLLYRRKSNARPRLPSFKGLGISSLDPQSVQDSLAQGAIGPGLNSRNLDFSSLSSRPTSSTQTTPLRPGSIPPLTPPEDLDGLEWTTKTTSRPCSSEKNSHTSIVLPSDPSASKITSASLSQNAASAGNMSFNPSETGGSGLSRATPTANTEQPSLENSDQSSWLDQSVGAAGEYTGKIYDKDGNMLKPILL
jgi:hypothetical protein